MGWLVAEIGLALTLAGFIVWWTMAPRRGGRDDDGEDGRDGSG